MAIVSTRSADWSLKHGSCVVEAWEDISRPVPVWTVKLTSLRKADNPHFSLERKQTFRASADGEIDEISVISHLASEAERWVERRRSEWLVKHGKKAVKRLNRAFRNAEEKKARSARRGAKPEVVPSVGVFEPIFHKPAEGPHEA